jgi:zinc transport system substrate-binding protein
MRPALALGALALLVAGCASVPEAEVVTASYPAHYLAERMAAGHTVHLLGRTGADLHEYEPTVQDVQALRHARLLLSHGLGVEGWVERTLRSLGTDAPRHVETSALPPGEGLIGGGEDPAEGEEHGHGHALDPHTWLDPLAYREQARRLAAAMRETFPDDAEAILAALQAVEADLDQLDRDFGAGLASCLREDVVTNHDAHGYLARRYGFHIHSLHGLEPGSEPAPGAVQEVIETIRREGIPVIFLEEGTDPAAVDAIRGQTGVEVGTLHTLEQRPRQGDYLTAQRANLASLRSALGCA